VWLDNSLTSAFDLYQVSYLYFWPSTHNPYQDQYFVRLPDDAVEKYLKMFTLLPINTITETVTLHHQHPEKRTAQHLLAQEVVTLIHGIPAAARAAIQTKLLFPSYSGEITNFSAKEILEAFAGDVGLVEVPREEVLNQAFTKVMRNIGAMKTKTEADKLIKSGGVYIGQEGKRVTDHRAQVVQEWLLDDEVFVFRI
jgi:tyrosyl-tRNA synthetase